MSYINEKNNLVPENTIIYYSSHPDLEEKNNWKVEDVYESLIGKQKRDYFREHAYLCLPLTIANQYGFVVKAAYDFEVFWPGGNLPAYVNTYNEIENNKGGNIQNIFTNFESGIISLEHNFVLRTPPGINLMTIQPPNYFIPGIHVMSGVVETDNLRRSFTFNLKVTTPKQIIKIKKGDWLSGFIPIKRYEVEKYKLVNFKEFFNDETYRLEKASIDKLNYERNGGDAQKNLEAGVDPENHILLGAGRRYFKGVFPNDEEFPDHQKRL